jgi:hypothetical protein
MIRNVRGTVPEIKGHFTIFDSLVEVPVTHGMQANDDVGTEY